MQLYIIYIMRTTMESVGRCLLAMLRKCIIFIRNAVTDGIEGCSLTLRYKSVDWPLVYWRQSMKWFLRMSFDGKVYGWMSEV